jgi:hypothetical protein
MPTFAGRVDSEELGLIQAYLLASAANASKQ